MNQDICSEVHEVIHDHALMEDYQKGARLPVSLVIEVMGKELWDFVLERLQSQGVDLSRDCQDEETAEHILKAIQLLVTEALFSQCQYDADIAAVVH